jgi:hypothetical protein
MDKFNAKKWVENEIDTSLDGNDPDVSRKEAAEHVSDLLTGDEYHDVLTDKQVFAALEYLVKTYPA